MDRERGLGGGPPNVDRPGQEEGGSQKFSNLCGHPLWMTPLEKRHLLHQVLTDLFATTVSESYKQEMRRQKLKRKDFQKILEESPYYKNEQIW